MQGARGGVATCSRRGAESGSHPCGRTWKHSEDTPKFTEDHGTHSEDMGATPASPKSLKHRWGLGVGPSRCPGLVTCVSGGRPIQGSLKVDTCRPCASAQPRGLGATRARPQVRGRPTATHSLNHGASLGAAGTPDACLL